MVIVQLICQLRLHPGPASTAALRDGILALWADVSNAGGAVGFVPPVTAEDIRPELAQAPRRPWRRGAPACSSGYDEDGAVAATAFLTYNTHRLMRHWIWLYTVMVHPGHQGKGYGRDLMAAAADAARGFDGIDAIRLTCRGGTGVDRFYASCGYKEVGPGARTPSGSPPGDDRDDITMLLPLADMQRRTRHSLLN